MIHLWEQAHRQRDLSKEEAMSSKNIASTIAIAVLILTLFILPMRSSSCAAEEKFGGIGLSVAQLFSSAAENNMGSLIVLDVFKGTPASESGIQRGDVITHIDGELTEGRIFERLILERLRGKAGSNVEISIRRAGVEAPLLFTLTRIEIEYTPER